MIPMMGSNRDYIESEVARARRDGAPANAVYKKHGTDLWVTTDDITKPSTRASLGLALQPNPKAERHGGEKLVLVDSPPHTSRFWGMRLVSGEWHKVYRYEGKLYAVKPPGSR